MKVNEIKVKYETLLEQQPESEILQEIVKDLKDVDTIWKRIKNRFFVR